MKPLIGFVVVGAILGMPGIALANEAIGAVKAIDASARRITLEDGKVYSYLGSQTATVGKLKLGDKIKVTFDPASQLFVSIGIHGSATKIDPAS